MGLKISVVKPCYLCSREDFSLRKAPKEFFLFSSTMSEDPRLGRFLQHYLLPQSPSLPRKLKGEKKMYLNNLVKGVEEDPFFKTIYLIDSNELAGTKKQRIIFVPNKSAKLIHKRLIAYLRSLPISRYAKGCYPGCSPVTNVRLHKENRFFYSLDIMNAYGFVRAEKLSNILCNLDERLLGLESEVLEFLLKHCFCHGEGAGLITGAPASPDLFNIYAGALLDEVLAEISMQYGLLYTRYLDDLLFSSSHQPIGKRKRLAIRQVINKAGFAISHHKSKLIDLKKGPAVINGIGIEMGGRLFVPRNYLKKIKARLYQALNNGDVSKEEIAGLMGVFWSAVPSIGGLNQFEMKVFLMFNKYSSLRRFF